jgi:hypothetical protein
MSFVTWLALPVLITLIASLIMLLVTRRPRTDTHHDIESFARFRVALARHSEAMQRAAERRPQR